MSLKKHLEGWQLAVVALTIAWGTAVIVVPRSVTPDVIPVPMLEPRDMEEVLRRDSELSRSVLSNRLEGHVRRLGSAVRAYGTCEARHDLTGLKDAKTALDNAALTVPSTEDVMRLRAYQTETFLKAIQTWEATGKVPLDLDELGGGFRDLLHDNEWVQKDGSHVVVVPGPFVLRAMFKKRWNEVVGAGSDKLALSHVEVLALAGFLLEHPPLPAGAAGSRVSAATYQDQMRLKKVAELEKIDSTYPANYARGIIQYRLGAYQGAVQSFGRYIEAFPSGPYRLRATNFLRASLDHAELE